MKEKKQKRVVFTFEPESLAALEKIQEDGSYESSAATVKDSLQILRVLQQCAQQGYTELIVRNPETDAEKGVLDHQINRGRDGNCK